MIGTGMSKLNDGYQVMKRTKTERTRETTPSPQIFLLISLFEPEILYKQVSNTLVGLGQIWTTLLNHISPKPPKNQI